MFDGSQVQLAPATPHHYLRHHLTPAPPCPHLAAVPTTNHRSQGEAPGATQGGTKGMLGVVRQRDDGHHATGVDGG